MRQCSVICHFAQGPQNDFFSQKLQDINHFRCIVVSFYINFLFVFFLHVKYLGLSEQINFGLVEKKHSSHALMNSFFVQEKKPLLTISSLQSTFPVSTEVKNTTIYFWFYVGPCKSRVYIELIA